MYIQQHLTNVGYHERTFWFIRSLVTRHLQSRKGNGVGLYSDVQGYHVYRDVWEPSVGEKLVAQREFDNHFDKSAVKVFNGEETVSHLPRKYSRIAWYFLAHGGSISVEVSGHRQHCKRLCGGMEIPCRVKFTCSRKAMLNRLKDLLTRKV